MIPKIIHYCWFGGNELNELAKKCIRSWQEICPDYEIHEWNEQNFDINSNIYIKEAYESKKWAFVSDYVRLKVLYDFGGIYMDTDVEVIKPLDNFLQYNAFSGFESNDKIPTGTMGACCNNYWIGELLKYYDNRHFILPDGRLDITTNVEIITAMTLKMYEVELNNSFQVIGDKVVLFPFDYLCAKHWENGKIKITENTYTVHHFNGSWLTEEDKLTYEQFKKLRKYCGSWLAMRIIGAIKIYRSKGIKGVCTKILEKI